jgi:hypothetical protein
MVPVLSNSEQFAMYLSSLTLLRQACLLSPRTPLIVLQVAHPISEDASAAFMPFCSGKTWLSTLSSVRSVTHGSESFLIYIVSHSVSLLTDFKDSSSYLDWTVGVHSFHITFLVSKFEKLTILWHTPGSGSLSTQASFILTSSLVFDLVTRYPRNVHAEGDDNTLSS